MARILDDERTPGPQVVQTWVGEDTSAADIVTGSGISSQEVGKLEQNPDASAATVPQTANSQDGSSSTFGRPNEWNGRMVSQCFDDSRTVCPSSCP